MAVSSSPNAWTHHPQSNSHNNSHNNNSGSNNSNSNNAMDPLGTSPPGATPVRLPRLPPMRPPASGPHGMMPPPPPLMRPPLFFVREIYKNGFLKRLPHNEKKSSAIAKLLKSDRYWVVFSVHDDAHPFLGEFAISRLNS